MKKDTEFYSVTETSIEKELGETREQRLISIKKDIEWNLAYHQKKVLQYEAKLELMEQISNL